MKTEINRFLTRQLRAVVAVGKTYRRRNLMMPGNPRYQPAELRPYFGYDQWVLWLSIVEICWLKFMDRQGYAPNLTQDLHGSYDFVRLFKKLTTTQQDKIERLPNIGHDINALRQLLTEQLPVARPGLIHHGLTSYDTIDTARALMFKQAFTEQMLPLLRELDSVWRGKMKEWVDTVQLGRTHLQTALPITVGLWLSVIHRRFIEVVTFLLQMVKGLTGKVSGAVGNSAALIALGMTDSDNAGRLEENFIVDFLKLGHPSLSTQIVVPERLANFLFQQVLLSGVCAQLGEDARLLQSSAIAEIKSLSSTSSTMAHKDANPIAAEQMSGMHTTVLGEFQKVSMNLVSDLQRDLRNSSPYRDYPAIMVYTFHQLKTARRLLAHMTVNSDRCLGNFEQSKHIIMGELLYLLLARADMPEAHTFVNKNVIPLAKQTGSDVVVIMDRLAAADDVVAGYWRSVDDYHRQTLTHPEVYLGRSKQIVLAEVENSL